MVTLRVVSSLGKEGPLTPVSCFCPSCSSYSRNSPGECLLSFRTVFHTCSLGTSAAFCLVRLPCGPSSVGAYRSGRTSSIETFRPPPRLLYPSFPLPPPYFPSLFAFFLKKFISRACVHELEREGERESQAPRPSAQNSTRGPIP